LSKEDIQKVIDDFKFATKRALEAGFDVIEIHAAHGYLLHQFYSPLSNQRTDEYGGGFQNRVRLTLEVVEAVKEIIPQNFPLLVRISASDWTSGGWTVEDSIELCRELKKAGVHLVDCSSGGNVSGVKIPLTPMYQTPFAARIKKEAGIMTGAVGLITTTTEAESILQNNEADLILLARQLLRDPYFPLHAAKELGVDVEWPLQYLRAKN
jgi:2,4-dienoyl-CoA reductase-like NADH-dependent reductase (Old Yellow Enzyme family)